MNPARGKKYLKNKPENLIGTFGVGDAEDEEVGDGLGFEDVCVDAYDDDESREEEEGEGGSRSRPRMATTLPRRPEFSFETGGTSSRIG